MEQVWVHSKERKVCILFSVFREKFVEKGKRCEEESSSEIKKGYIWLLVIRRKEKKMEKTEKSDFVERAKTVDEKCRARKFFFVFVFL